MKYAIHIITFLCGLQVASAQNINKSVEVFNKIIEFRDAPEHVSGNVKHIREIDSVFFIYTHELQLAHVAAVNYFFNRHGELTKKTEHLIFPSSENRSSVTRYAYNDKGYIKSIMLSYNKQNKEEKPTLNVSFNDQGKPVKVEKGDNYSLRILYDDMGNIIKTMSGNDGSILEYDENGNLLKQICFTSGDSLSGGEHLSCVWIYRNDRIITFKTYSDEGKPQTTTTYEYDSEGNIFKGKFKMPDGTITEFVRTCTGAKDKKGNYITEFIKEETDATEKDKNAVTKSIKREFEYY